jgi:hypothetical protein
MSYLNDRVYDNGLSVLDTEATHLYLCSAEPSTYAGVSSVALASYSGVSVGSPAAGSPNGRKVTVAAITSGMTASASGTGSHYALTDNTNSRLLAAGTLAATQVVTSGNPVTLTAFDIRIPGPA